MFGIELDPARQVEAFEAVEYLRQHGYGSLLDALADTALWTAGAADRPQRPNLSKVARRLRITDLTLRRQMNAAAVLLEQPMPFPHVPMREE